MSKCQDLFESSYSFLILCKYGPSTTIDHTQHTNALKLNISDADQKFDCACGVRTFHH